MAGKYQALFTPLKIGTVQIKNRIVMCPMGGTALIENGRFHETAANFYIERAKGGVGLIVPGIAHITDMWGRGGWLHEAMAANLEPLRRTMKTLHSYDCKLFMQIGAGMGRVLSIHSGMLPKDSDLVKAMNAPSAGLPNVWCPERKHREITKKEIQAIIDSFIRSAKLAQEAEIDGVEIHAIHEGYLLDQFAVAATNHRSDEYGGSLENRLRFVTEIIKGIKAACGTDFPVTVRYSVASKMKGFNSGALPGEAYREFGRSLEESPQVAQLLEAAGCDALNADNGSYDAWFWAHPPMYMPMACNLPEAMYIKNFVRIPVICAGRMEDPDISAPAVANGSIDAIGLARQMLCDPEWPNKVRDEKITDIRPCIACHNGCFGRLFAGKGTSCALNPAAMQEEQYKIEPARTAKRVAIVGGGIAGMEAARICRLRGHDVTIYEKSDKLGGVFTSAAAPDFKEADKKLLKWYIKQITDLRVDVRFNTEATPETIKQSAPDAMIIATGAKPKKIPVPGIEGDQVIEAIDLLLKKKTAGERVVVVGGGLTGCEIAYDLAREGKKVAVLEMMDDILKIPGLSAANGNMLRELLNHYQVEVYTSARLSQVTPSGVCFTVGREEKRIAADSIVLAVGYDSYAPLAEELGDGGELYTIGDAKQVGNLMDAVWAAYDVALKI